MSPANASRPGVSPGPTSAPLAGLRVAVTRSVDRAGALLAALEGAGAEPVLVPVIDFEVGDHDALDAALRRLEAGEYRWVVISSITTVRALKQWCETAGTSLTELIPASTSVATIGPTSVAVLAAEGIRADLAPVDAQSAAGLVELWPSNTSDGGHARVLLPQSNLAEPTLADGLAAKGWEPETVTAYKTVDYPAAPELRLTATLELRSPERGWRDFLPSPRKLAGEPSKISYAGRPATEEILLPARGSGRQARTFGTRDLLTPAEAAREIRAGAIDAVVLASGSAARRVAETMGPLPERCLVIAIGQPTRAEAERLGLRVAATAVHPTPDGIVAALAAAVLAARHPARHPTQSSDTGDTK